MPRKERRIDYILDRLKEGASNGQVLHELELRNAHGQLERAIGIKSEQQVRAILSEQPMVERVVQSVPCDKKDRRGVDLLVFLRKCEFNLSMDSIAVQVKSSRKRIEEFKRDYMVKHGLEADEVEEHMRLNRIVILNGRDNEQTIVASFLQQVEAIDDLRKQRFK